MFFSSLLFLSLFIFFIFFFFNDTATTEIYTLSLHDALPIFLQDHAAHDQPGGDGGHEERSEEHTSELQSLAYLVCRLLLEKKKKTKLSSTADANKQPLRVRMTSQLWG